MLAEQKAVTAPLLSVTVEEFFLANSRHQRFCTHHFLDFVLRDTAAHQVSYEREKLRREQASGMQESDVLTSDTLLDERWHW